jgi:phosphohistidine phosphatase
MNLYLIRHGVAEDTARTDAERALTKEGLKDVQKMAREVMERAKQPERLFVSPYLRAKQTAEPFAERWKLKAEIAPWLMPGAEVSDVLESLEECQEKSLALVGHMPNLGLVLSALVWGLPPREILVPKGGVALLKTKVWKPGEARLKWLLNPDLL